MRHIIFPIANKSKTNFKWNGGDGISYGYNAGGQNLVNSANATYTTNANVSWT
jgi:hypothetical protein